jgi:hypothetical protein
LLKSIKIKPVKLNLNLGKTGLFIIRLAIFKIRVKTVAPLFSQLAALSYKVYN